MDEHTTLEALRKRVSHFRDERDWLKDNTPKNLAISITVESAELLDHFQWKTDDQVRGALHDKTKKNQVSEELADVLILCLSFSDVMGIDVSEAIETKLRKASEKYPATKTSPRPEALKVRKVRGPG